MKINLLLFFIAGLALGSCYDTPEYPIEPKIAFENIIFKEVGTNTDPDSLIMSIHFEDGDGDLGLDSRFTDVKFRNGDFYIDTQTGELITTKHLGTTGFDDLPPYELPYSCENWIEQPTFANFCSLAGIQSDCEARIEEFGLNTLVNEQSKIILDTLYFVPNINRNNFFLTFLVETDSADVFEEFDWINSDQIFDPCAINLNLTFPPISDDGKRFVSEGIIRYSFTANRIPNVFGNKRLKIKLVIKDRALHDSNEAFSKPFTIQEISVN